MDKQQDKRRTLYDQLTNDGYDLGDFQSFSTNLNDSIKRRNLYEAITKDNYDVGDYDSFSRNLDGDGTNFSTTHGEVLDTPEGSPQLPEQSPDDDKGTLFANYVQEQLGNIDNELNKPREALPMPAGSAFIPSTAVAAAQRYGNVQTREQQDRYTSLVAARNFLDDANKLVTEAGKKGNTNFAAGALRGLRDKGFDPDTWMMGISETSYYNLLRQAAEKEERGEQLSAEEQQLLDAAAVNMAANAYYAQDLGRGYKAGAVTAESIPFMLQFALNPLSGAGKGMAKTILEHGIKRFGLNTAKRTAAGRAVRGAARVAGDAVATAGVTATTGLGNAAEDAARRMTGDVQFVEDEQGNVQYAGRVNNVEDTGEAIAHAFASTFFENQSEMVGNYFAPIMRGVSGLVKRIPGVKQLSASKVGELYRGIKNNPTYKEFTDRTQWHGAIGEYAEEVYNNLASVAMGDMTPEELVDLDNNIDTFLGVGLMSAVFGGIGAAGFARDRYTLNRDIRRFEDDLTPEEMEQWQEVKQAAASGDVEGVREFVKYTMRDNSLTPQEKKDEIAYIYDVMRQSAIENVAAEQTEEAVQAETDDIVANSDPQTNTYTECSRLVMNDVGETVEVPGHIVGYMSGQPLWKPDSAGPEVEAVVLKEGEYNPESIQSMPTQEVIDETAQAIREDAAAQAQRESTYSPDIVPPSIGVTFVDGASQYQIAQQNPDGGWIATKTTVDDKGEQKQEVVSVTDEQYYNAMQTQIDAQEAIGQRIIQQPNNSPINETNNTISPTESESNTLEQSPQSVPSEGTEEADRIPTDEKGNLLYHRAPVETTVASINGEGLEPEEVDAFVQANKDASAKQLKSIEGKAPKMGTNIAKYKADKAAWQARVADAQAQVDYWNQVGDAIAAQRMQVGDTTAEDIRSMGEPLNGHELAAMMLATGQLPLLQSDFIRETGYRNGEARALFGLFASEANGGMTIERAGEQLMLADQEEGTNFFDPNDPNAGRNAILDVLAEVRTRGDLTNYIRRNREAMAERERQAEYDAYADWCNEVMHMMPEEYEAYQAYVNENNPYEGVSFEELDRIFAEAEEEIQTNLNQQDNGQGTSENGSETDSGSSEHYEPAGETGSRETGVSVLPETQPVLPRQIQGRTGGTETEPGPDDDGVRVEERAVSEGASGDGGITDNQGNPVDNDGHLITERVNDVSEISDVDFTHPTRNIELPKLPNVVDETIGTNGKPVIIKRNIFERNAQRHGDLLPENSREILREALYNPSLYGQNQKAKKPYNWVLINVPDNNGNNRVVLLEVNHHKDNVEIIHWHYVDERGLEKIKRQAEREDGQLLILPSVISEEVGALSDPTLSLSSEGKDSNTSANDQTNSGFIAPSRQEDENLLDYAERVTKAKEIADARKEVSSNPTDAQKEAGNYKKGHITLDGYDITIENPKGSTRSGVDANGQSWSVTMNNDYGYIRGTEGVDGDHIDVFLSDDPTTGDVFVIDQVNEDGTFDEHKVMYGFKSALAAKRAYLANYSPGWKGLGNITKVSKEEFKKWVDSSHRKTKPFAEYKNVKKESVSGSFDEFVRDSGDEIIPDGVTRLDIIRFAERVIEGFPSHTESYDTYNAERTDVEIPSGRLFKSERDWFSAKNGDVIVVYDLQNKSSYELVGHKDAQGYLKSVSVIKYYGFDHKKTGLSVSKTPDTVFEITPAQYITKRGKVLDMFLVTFAEPLSKERQRAARELAKTEKGWYDRDKGGFMMRSEESARKLADTITGNEEVVSDAQPLSLADTQKLENPERETDILVQESESSEQDEGNVYGASNKLVSRERYEELKERMRRKFGGQMNMGIDPEILAIGTEMAAFHIEAGARKFVDYARHMIDDLGDAIRPYLKSFYNGARDLPEVEAAGLTTDMDSYEEVSRFDVANFDKDVPNVLDAAETIAKEQEVEQQAETAKDILTEQRDAEIDGLRPATEADIENNPIVFYNGNGYGILMVVRTGEQISPTTFSKSHITGVVLHNGKSVPLKDLKVRDTNQTTLEQEKIRGGESTFKQNTQTIEKKSKSKKKRARKSVPLSLNDLFTQTENNSNEQGSTEPDSSLGGRAREEIERTELRGDRGGLHGDNVPDTNGSRRVPEPASTNSRQPVVRNQRNYRFGEEGIRVPQGDIAKLKSNVEAIRTLKEIEASGQPATDEQKEILSRYVGWGGLADALNEDKYNARNSYYKDANWNSKYLPYYEQLRELLSEEEFQSAIQSTTTSHYTPTPVIRALWDVVQRSGFKGGVVSEPAMGVGHIIGLMPAELSAQSRIGGYEIDSLSGRIASQLYPDADVKVQGYETNFAPQTKDLVITNVPFGRNAPYDKKLDRSLKRELGNAYNLHNYFIAKSLLELKEGGLGVFVTSSATMDGSDSHFREFVAANNIDLVGAIRLPNNAFLQNAGTSVTADILVFRKRKTGEPFNGIGFVSTTQIGEGTYEENGETRTKPILVNEYFAGHPDMMLGEMMTAFDAGSGGLYSGASQTLKPKAGANLSEELEKAVTKLPENILSNADSVVQLQERETTSLKNGTITTKDGKVYVAVNGELAPVEAKETFTFNGKERKTVDAVDDYNALKDTLKKLIATEQSEEADPKALRKQLNEQYDAFVSKYGTLNRNKALDDVFAEDYEHNLPLSLEEVSRVPSATGISMVWQVKKGKGILDRRVSYPVNEPVTADNLQDAVNISLSYKGTLDIPYMARLMDVTEEQVTDEILEQGAAYRDPITGALVDRDTYLSGNVREKLEEARAAAESNPGYQKNVEDLMAVQPETIRFGDISYRLGTPWIPTEYINDFVENVLGISGADVQFEPLLNEFVISRRAHITDFAKSGLYKTERMGTIDLFVNALNQRKPKIYDEHTTYGSAGKSTIRVPNEAETQAASEKIMEISDKFIEYIDGRSGIHRELERIYNDRYNNYQLKKYSLPFFSHKEKGKDGKEVLVTHYPGSNESISLREHQAKAVQRSLHESTLLAHQVGTGKTFTMITTAMEMRRLGLARKPMIVVQNATLEDFVKDFYRLYPSANVLAPNKDERSAENRKRLFNLIATGDFDAIVIPQSFLAFIPDDEGRKKELIQKRIDEYLEAIAKTDDSALQRRLQKEMQGLRESLEGGEEKKSKKSNVKEKAKAADRAKTRAERVLDRRTDDVMSFEKLGIDALFIDEAHNFKKIGFATKMNNVKGVDSGSSQRANSLLLKARWVQEKNGGRNVILATGTPITNTMAEVWTMMNFVSPDILDAYNIHSFDDFATTFGTVEPSLEFTATGNFKIADRFKSYVNVPELLKAFRSHADVVLTEDVKEFQQYKNIPKLDGGKMENIVIDKNEDLQDVMDMLVRELEDYNKLTGQAKREKSALPLVVFTKAKQAAIDLRLLNPSYADNPNSKTNQVVRNIIKLYKESTPDKGTQLVFCDSYQSPGERSKMDLFDYDPDVPRFNLYEDMKEKLVAAGIPAKEIAIVNNYDGDRRKALFEKVRNGDVRILLGSTEKMGVGVNVQDRLFALHHVDAPLRPMDFEQRNGRILRQGNLYATWDKPVHVLTYGVQGTLDATAYDRLRVKQEFINQMMKGNTDSRVMEEQDDEDPSGMTFSQMAATLSGDKTAQLLFAAQNKLKRLRNSKRSDANSKSEMADSIESAKRRIKFLQESKDTYEKAVQVINEYFPNGVKKIEVNGQNFIEKLGSNLDPIIDAYDEAYSLNRSIAPLKLNLNDGAAEVVVHYNEGRMVYELYAGKKHIVESRQFNGGRGLMSSISHQLDVIKKNLSDTEANIREQENKIKGLTKAMNTPWGREEELKEAEKEVDNLQKQLEEKAKENSQEQKDVYRDGNGALTDNELSNVNDPISKMLGKSTRTARQRQAFAERERSYMVRRAESISRKLHLDNVDIVTDASALSGRRAKAKGFYNPVTGKITIVIPNHTNEFDVAQTLLHEAVAHYGLRRLFGEHFDTFLDNVYRNADLDVRKKIVELAKKNGWDTRLATEEYLASLAENTNFEDLNASWWQKIKELFLQMLHKIGFNDFNGVMLSDNELRYILWRSYENLAEPGRYRSILGEAVDIVKQNELNVGNYAASTTKVDKAAEEINDLYRITPDGLTSDDGTREAYNHAVSGNRFKAQEAYQDSMLALKRLQEVIEQKTGKLKSYENAYLAENQMSSKSTRETEVYGEKFFKPMLEAVGKLMEKGASYGEIIDYMVAKHGLERNEVFAKRDAEQEADHRYEKLYKEIEQLYKLGGITEKEYNQRKNKLDTEKEEYYQNRLAKHLDEDYSGLTALAEKYDAIDEGFKAHAQKLISDFEDRFDTKDLWEKVNAATKETLRKSYESGMMSRDAYDKVSKLFKYYIPLRGWDEQTAEDVYEYLNSETSPVNSVLKTAKGRRSMADDPLATIGNMAESTILQGNRNLMKQTFLNMAINHPTDVLTLKEAWYVQDPNTGDWVLSFPDIREGDDASAISAKVEEHEQRMQELKANGLATQVKEGLDINYRIGARQAQEHIVTVKRNGKDYLIFVNGNPRAAQAVNGLTNPTVESNKLLEGIARFNRELAANFTNRNPAFVLSNLSRDLIFSVSAVAIKENPKYAAKFAKNIPRAMRVIFRNLRNKGSETNIDDRMFEEFLSNGGETGYTSLHSVDEYKKMVQRSVGKYSGKKDYFAAVRAAARFFSMMNRWAEDVSRFTTYMTSREEGRTITESVNDAKEVTVNFNRRGAATKTSGVFGWTSGLFRNLYLFFNAAVQSLTNFARLAQKNRKGFLTTLGGFTAAGFLVPYLNTIAISMLGGDDDDYYGNLPDWVRRNNLCIYAGNGKFITIPLPIELRAFYGLGEMAYQASMDGDYDKDQIAYQAINQITELLPINPLGNNGDLVTTLMPDVLSPFWEIYENKDFTGKPVYRDNAFNKTMPEWTKAYNSTSDWLVNLSKWTNELAGGDDYKQADVLEPIMNWNPAKVEHLFESYFGGMAKTFNQAAKTLAGGVESAIDGEKSDKLQWYSTPVLNRFVNDASDDRSSYSKVNQRYYQLYNLYDEVQKLIRGYANDAARGNLNYLEKLNELYQSKDYKKYLIFKSNKRAIDRIRDIEKRLPEESSEQRKKLQEETNKLKRQLLEMVDKLE